jgi:hypothetical protein
VVAFATGGERTVQEVTLAEGEDRTLDVGLG